MNLSSQVTSLIDDPYLELFSLLVFERLTVEPLWVGCGTWTAYQRDIFNDARDKQRLIHKQRKGE